jgi:hypothetical protein
MQLNDSTEPLDLQELRHSLDHWAAISSHMIGLLHETAGYERSRNWRPHLAQIARAIRAFGDRCRAESHDLGSCRADDVALCDAFGRLREHGQRLVDWLQRMIPE